jgi:hypothetical protein
MYTNHCVELQPFLCYSEQVNRHCPTVHTEFGVSYQLGTIKIGAYAYLAWNMPQSRG